MRLLRALLLLLLALVSLPLTLLYLLLRLTRGTPRRSTAGAWTLPRRGLIRDAMRKHRA